MTDVTPTPQFTPLPTPLTSLVGRERETAQVCSLLQRDDVHLVTLTGPGGVGKTRLALAAAMTLQPVAGDSIVFVGLAHICEPALVASAIARALGVAESGDDQPVATVIATLRRATMPLVLDNFEQVLDAAPLVVTLLGACPRLTVLVTSRAALHVSGEREYSVLPLATAAETLRSDAVATTPAIRLFVERATAVDPGFALTDDNAAAIAAICQRLDGLPLAIELAAARSKVLSPALLLPRLSHRLPLLTRGPRDAPARLQTMYDAITWSHDLLTPTEQVLFRRLSVFVGGFTLDAAESVCRSINEGLEPPGAPAVSILDGITSLVDKSLVQWDAGPERGDRLGMLETIREFALERLEAAGEGAHARTTHAAYFDALVARLNPNRIGSGEHVDERLRHLEAEMPNLRAAFTHLAAKDDAEGVLRLAGGLAVFWQLRGFLREGQQWLEWGFTHSAELPAAARGRGLTGLALIRWAQGDRTQAASLAQEALAIANPLDDREVVAAAVHMLGLVAEVEQRWDEAGPLLEQSLAAWRELGDKAAEAMTLHLLGDVAYGL
ncbi:MAG: tetratricopeptide repeat protein, partial [Thermomicrobiales bacterium]|nr:tetratricopeptide repeat protein [Thermomicrobiales bacterium]